jgi:hypothetical protein
LKLQLGKDISQNDESSGRFPIGLQVLRSVKVPPACCLAQTKQLQGPEKTTEELFFHESLVKKQFFNES